MNSLDLAQGCTVPRKRLLAKLCIVDEMKALIHQSDFAHNPILPDNADLV